MLELFALGLFYDSDRTLEDENEEDKTVTESLEKFNMRDIWIAIYTMIIVIPVPIILVKFFTRKELNPMDPAEVIEKAKK